MEIVEIVERLQGLPTHGLLILAIIYLVAELRAARKENRELQQQVMAGQAAIVQAFQSQSSGDNPDVGLHNRAGGAGGAGVGG